MPARALVLALAAGCAALAAGGAGGAVAPGRTTVEPGPVTALALTGRTVAFGSGRAPAGCRVRVWETPTKALLTLGRGSPSCAEETSTGTGISDVAVAARRVLWIGYTGGNTRDWQLFTATPTRRAARLLRSVARPVDDPPPLVLGAGTTEGVPYAVDRTVTYLRENGSAAFRRTLASPVRLLAAGPGPGGRRVAAALADGTVVTMTAAGAVVDTTSFTAGSVRAVRLVPGGVVVQVGREVRTLAGAPLAPATLPSGALVLDVAERRALYRQGRELRVRHLASGTDTLLVRGPAGSRPLGQLEPQGLAWSSGRTVNWTTAALLPA